MMRGAIQKVVVVMAFRKRNKNWLESRAVAYQ